MQEDEKTVEKVRILEVGVAVRTFHNASCNNIYKSHRVAQVHLQMDEKKTSPCHGQGIQQVKKESSLLCGFASRP